MWMIGTCSARARPSSRPISARAGSMPASGSLPSTYSRCASMTTTVESESGGGTGVRPAISSIVFGFMRTGLLQNDEHREGVLPVFILTLPPRRRDGTFANWLVGLPENSERAEQDRSNKNECGECCQHIQPQGK